MKKLLLNSALFFVFLVLVLNIVGLFLPKYYGNGYYSEKYHHFLETKGYNTIIFGSSRMYRQLDPSILDQEFVEQDIRAFNLGAPATHNPEFYYLYEQLLETKTHAGVEFVFIELEPLNKIAIKNLITSRNNYWLNLEQIGYANAYVNSSNYGGTVALRLKLSYSFSLFWKILGFQNPKQLIKEGRGDQDLGNVKNGFKPLDHELRKKDNKNWVLRQNEFLMDTMVIQRRIQKIERELENGEMARHLNKFHLKKINKLIKKSNKNGIHLIFVVPPKLPDYKEIYALLEYIPSQHFIDISSPRKYPLLYESQYTFDVGHLNQKGAKLFSNYVAKELKRKKILDIP